MTDQQSQFSSPRTTSQTHVGCNLIHAGTHPLNMNMGPSLARLMTGQLHAALNSGVKALTMS